MTGEKAIRILETGSCYECTWGCESPTKCTCPKCNLKSAIKVAIEALEEKRPHGECNQCLYYDGVHGVQGHAPCWHWNIGGVMWNDYCSRFEKEGDEK